MFQFIKEFILYTKVARIQTLVMSFLPCILAYVYCKPRISNFSAFILVCIAIILFHLSVNTISEYRDCVNGVDNPNSPGTKYRLVTGIVSKQSILYLGLISFCIASICGIIAVIQSSFVLIIPGFLSACIVLFYSEKPLCIKYKGLGELAVFLCYGVLLGFSTVYAATSSCSVTDILVFIPGALLIVNVLLVNNIRDYFFDKLRITTLTTIIGIKKSYNLLYIITNSSYILYSILAFCEIIPQKTHYVWLTYPIVLITLKHKNHPKLINLFGLLFTLTELIVIFALA